MLPAERQQQLIARFEVIEDLQERLAAVVGLGRKGAPLAEGERIDAHRVQGCASRVWLLGELHEGRCHFRLDADSAIVKGLAIFLCEIYQGTIPREAAGFEATALESLHLMDQLSPTRRHGLLQVQRAIRAFAENA